MAAHPVATYRRQLHPGFDFDAAAGVNADIDALDELLDAQPGGRWADVITGAEWDGEVGLDGLLDRFPVALLERTGADA